jgi:hypothetical protein
MQSDDSLSCLRLHNNACLDAPINIDILGTFACSRVDGRSVARAILPARRGETPYDPLSTQSKEVDAEACIANQVVRVRTCYLLSAYLLHNGCSVPSPTATKA